MNYLVTRHPGALDWLQSQIPEPYVLIGHLTDLNGIMPGDCVMGTLPLHLIAGVCVQGARFFHLDVDLPDHLRGVELTMQQLIELEAALVEYRVLRHLPDSHLIALEKSDI
jgi:CRISPR-associated protein Csx16